VINGLPERRQPKTAALDDRIPENYARDLVLTINGLKTFLCEIDSLHSDVYDSASISMRAQIQSAWSPDMVSGKFNTPGVSLCPQSLVKT
jgi:hypothetical protein